MGDIYWTSDTHFGHRNIIKYCKRPFASKEEIESGRISDASVQRMDEALIANWNAIVKPGDTVYHLGDFANATKVTRVQSILDRLHGTKHLCPGNHDRKLADKVTGWTSIEPYRELRMDGELIVMLHYGMRVWNKSHRGAIQLYGPLAREPTGHESPARRRYRLLELLPGGHRPDQGTAQDAAGVEAGRSSRCRRRRLTRGGAVR